LVGFVSDAIVVGRKGTIGSVYEIDGPFWPIDTVYYVTSKANADRRWLAETLRFLRLDELNEGTGVPGLNRTNAYRQRVIVPPLHQQQLISEILSSVDEAILATEAVIAQTEKVKQVTLTHLLTKGIGHSRFKETELGDLPESWEVAELQALLADVQNAMRSGPFGSSLLKSELVDEGVPFLGIDNIHTEEFRSDFTRFVSPEKFKQLERYAANPNDVIITIMGTVGRSCVFPGGMGQALSSKHIWTMTFDEQRYVPQLVCWQLNFANWVRTRFGQSSQGGTMPAINSSVLRKVLLPVPPIDEQKKIASILDAFNESLAVHRASLAKNVKVKSNLMSDLLSGQKQVAVGLADDV
jgi:type I restriction enzyme S subunit